MGRCGTRNFMRRAKNRRKKKRSNSAGSVRYSGGFAKKHGAPRPLGPLKSRTYKVDLSERALGRNKGSDILTPKLGRVPRREVAPVSERVEGSRGRYRFGNWCLLAESAGL